MKNDKLNLGHLQVIPKDEEENIIALIEQLNGLLDRYNALFELYAKSAAAARLAGVLYDLEKTIAVICARITKGQHNAT